MRLLTDLALRSSVILAIGLIVNMALARRSAALRHFALAATIFATAAVVPLSLWLPVWTVPIAPQTSIDNRSQATGAAVVTTAVENTSVAATSSIDLASLAAVGWTIGCAVTGLFLLVGIWRLWRTARRAHVLRDARWTSIAHEVAESHGLRRPVGLLLTDESELLATWGLLRPRVLLPPHAREWSEDRIRIVLCHELAHVRR